MRLALVHDYLAQDGGAERVLKAMSELWPEAPIFLLFHDKTKIKDFPAENIRESWLSKMPFIKSHFQWYLPLMPTATERFNLSDFDVVVSSTSGFAKGVLTSPNTLHISYCHTPARYLWSDTHTYVADLPYNPAVKALLPGVISRLRLWDKMSTDRVDHFVANSATVRYRINKYYRRESDIIFPPTDTHLFSPSASVEDYFVAGGRLVPYKRLDMVVQAFNRLRYPLKIFGTGPELEHLQKHAKPNIEFVGRISDEAKGELLRHAKAFIHPQLEDFGITPVETMAAGRPVIAYGEGGATETVVPGETGVFFQKQSWESLLDAVLHFDHTAWNSANIKSQAEKFSVANFKTNLKQYVDNRYEEFKTGLSQPVLIQ